MAILTINHYIDSIKSFINSVENSQNSYYAFFARPQPWVNSSGTPDDTNIPLPDTSVYQMESSIYNDIVFGKIIANNNIAFIVPRYNWTSGTVYNQYSQNDANLYTEQFYVLTDAGNVFKVIDNNGGAASTVKPSMTTQYGTFSTSDGYVWKYMYTIDSNSNTNFTSTNYMPVVANGYVTGNAVPGTIDVYRTVAAGSGYPYYTGNIVAPVTNNVVEIDSLASNLNDYYTGCSIYLSSGFDSGQVRQIIKYDGFNKLVTTVTPFDLHGFFNLSSIVNPTAFAVNNLAVQNVETVSTIYKKGSFQVGDTIIQTDTNANAVIVTLNDSTMNILRGSSNGFSINLPIYNASQTGTLKTGTVSVTNNSVYVNSYSGTSFTTDYSVGDYIRVGSTAFTNIRKVVAVNNSVVTVDYPFTLGALTQNTHYSMPYALEPSAINYNYSSGVIQSTNMNGVKITYSNPSVLALNFSIGETIDMVNSANSNQGISGVVSFSNTSAVILTSVTGGSFTTGFYIRGESTLQRASIASVDTYPNITVVNPKGNFVSGFPIFARDPVTSATLGTANTVSYSVTPNQLTQYIISPTVSINGDGVNAAAYALVDTSPSSVGGITAVKTIRPGSGYTFANISIVSNTSHGSGANVFPVISPVMGHGYDPYLELGARYAGITLTVDNGANENYKFPIYGNYRKFGIIKNPLFNDVTVNLNNFDRVKMTINTVSTPGFANNEYVYQANSGAVGIVVGANNTFIELKRVKGTFSFNKLFANGATSNDNIVGLTTNTTANVATANVEYFRIVPSGVDILSEVSSGANAQIALINSNTQLNLTNVYGRFKANDVIYDASTNAYANVASILISNATVDVTSSFGTKFNQTLRFPLTSNIGAFQQYETVTQDVTGAFGTVISNSNEYDIVYTSANGTFTVGNYVRNSTNTANGYVTFANSTYLRVTSVQGTFLYGQTIINNLNIGATVSGAYQSLVLSGVGGPNKFQSGNIRGVTSGSTGTSASPTQIQFPDLVRNTGQVIYLENLAPFQLSNTSKELVKLVIQF